MTLRSLNQPPYTRILIHISLEMSISLQIKHTSGRKIWRPHRPRRPQTHARILSTPRHVLRIFGTQRHVLRILGIRRHALWYKVSSDISSGPLASIDIHLDTRYPPTRLSHPWHPYTFIYILGVYRHTFRIFCVYRPYRSMVYRMVRKHLCI